MRYFDRTQVPRPGCLDMDNKKSAAYKELQRNIKNSKAKVFNVYSDDAVKAALEKLFHGKCSYCESYYSATQPVDVEHFRPKNDKTGYFWLAAVWENLLPSCIDCNRERYQYLFDPLTGILLKKDKKAGKHDHFPLSGAKATVVFNSTFIINNANLAATIAGEPSLLLNPTVDNIDDLFTFTDEAIIAPSKSTLSSPGVLARVDKTIELLGLNRVSLVARRKEILLSLKVLIYTADKLVVLLNDRTLAGESRELVKDLLFYLFKEMHRCSAPTFSYSQMCRITIEQHFGKLPSVSTK
jgi:hypothetical protein